VAPAATSSIFAPSADTPLRRRCCCGRPAARAGRPVVVVASKGGADVHPAWYHNIKGGTEASFQIASEAFQATWREPQGAEREAVWAFMEKVYPPYRDYQVATRRTIPLVMLTPRAPVEAFHE